MMISGHQRHVSLHMSPGGSNEFCRNLLLSSRLVLAAYLSLSHRNHLPLRQQAVTPRACQCIYLVSSPRRVMNAKALFQMRKVTGSRTARMNRPRYLSSSHTTCLVNIPQRHAAARRFFGKSLFPTFYLLLIHLRSIEG